MDNAMDMRSDAKLIYTRAIEAALPDNAVRAALKDIELQGNIYLIAVGKAAWQMGKTASEILGSRIKAGIVITKHGYNNGDIAYLDVYEAGHPVPDADSYTATEKVLDMVKPLGEGDCVLFLLSGGGSALFEKPLIPVEDMSRLTNELLASGADINEINTLRKRFSAVKGGKFALACMPAKVYNIVLSDVIGDRVDSIASGPVTQDTATSKDAKDIADKYGVTLTEKMRELISAATPTVGGNVETRVIGSVNQLCLSAAETCKELGYEPFILTSSLSCSAKDAGVFLSNIAQQYASSGKKLAFIAGGETVVFLSGDGLGGRNQELALAAAENIAGMPNVCVFSVGSDGTDGPTDAAGGYVNGTTKRVLADKGISIFRTIQNNDSYHALDACGGLIRTGATGTNVNDLSVLLIG